jgi:pilus assembly protein CpaC
MRLNARFYFIVFLFTFLIFNSYSYVLSDNAEEIKLYLGEPKIIPVSNPSRIVIGNPAVADVAQVTKTEMTLSPKAVGSTTLVYWDTYGEQSYRLRVFSTNIDEIKHRVDNMLARLNLPKVYTQAAEDEGKVVLLGTVKDAPAKEKIAFALGPDLKENILDLIEVKEEEAAIDIDVQVLELNKGATDTLGFTWPGSINFLEVGSKGLTGTTWGKVFRIANVERGTSAGSDPFTLKLDALIQEGKARILSRPRLACQSGKEAELLVGGEKPVFTTAVQSTVGASTSVEYKEYGIKLKIKPTVNEEKRIKLALNVEVSDVGEAETIGATNAPTARAYPLSKRSASTELFLDDGQTMAIGGLIRQKSQEDLRKFPWLADVPVLGVFFRQRVTKTGDGYSTRGDTELFITLTPRIIGGEKPAAAEEVEKEVKPKVGVTASVSAESLPDNIAGYASIIQKRILDNLVYPRAAKEAGFQGTTKLGLRLSFRGELLEAKVKATSGYQILDDNALAIAEGITSYPPFPSSIEQKELWIDVPILYKLD